MNDKIPELLAPAGGWSQMKAAVQNGADAVYMGGPLFNARMRADNFSYDEMKDAIEYAHIRNVRVYITVNTLIRDDELFKAFSYIDFLYKAGADAVILQDMGLARLVGKYLPDLPMHLSTQGTVYNKWAVDTVKELGFCRIVPARELSLAEIETFSQACHEGDHTCEVEVFVHGALCMCYSGQCQMSRVLGGVNGRSGNRGLCAQPCRLPYENDDGEKSFWLSPKDICTLEDIPRLCRAGVDSLKIEGRLKSPQYVALVTSIYRKYLDLYRETGHVKVQEDDMRRLAQIFNRGGFSKGYLYGNPRRALLSGDSPKNRGTYVGRVKSVKAASTLVDVKLDCGSLSMGDGVEIHSRETTGNVISYRKVLTGNTLRIGDIKGAVKPGDKVYKVTDKGLLSEAEESYASDFIRRIPVEMRFEAVLGKPPILLIREICRTDKADEMADSSPQGGGEWLAITGTCAAEKALHKPLDEERVRKQLGKLGNTVFEADEIKVELEEGISLPISTLNDMRRRAADALMEEKRRVNRGGLTEEELEKIRQNEIACGEVGNSSRLYRDKATKTVHIYDKETLTSETLIKELKKYRAAMLCVPIELYMDGQNDGAFHAIRNKTKCEILPYILNVSKGNLDEYVENRFSQICEKVADTGILIGNLGWIREFQKAGIKVYGDYGLNIYNDQSVKTFEELGVEILNFSHEAEASRFEDIPLMITEHPVDSACLTDRKGETYAVMTAASGDKYMIFQKVRDK